MFAGNYCSGKSTAMRQRAEQLRAEGREPICIDHDDIAQAFGSPRSHGHGDAISALTVRVRGLAIKAALELHRDTGADVLIVDASPTAARLEQYRKAGAEIVALDVPLDELHCRAEAERPPEWHRFIDEWRPVREYEPQERKRWRPRADYRKPAHGWRYEKLRKQFLADPSRTNCETCGVLFRTDRPCTHRQCRGRGCHHAPDYPTVGHVDRLVEGGRALDISLWIAQCLRCNERDGGRVARARQRERAERRESRVELDW